MVSAKTSNLSETWAKSDAKYVGYLDSLIGNAMTFPFILENVNCPVCNKKFKPVDSVGRLYDHCADKARNTNNFLDRLGHWHVLQVNLS